MTHKTIIFSVAEAVRAAQCLQEPEAVAFLNKSAEAIAEGYRKGNKLLIAGNGGSLCDAMHFAEELTGQFRTLRPALSAIALSDPGHLSCVANDMGFSAVFSRGVEAHGKADDIFVALTTSGNSSNLLHAVEKAKDMGLFTIAFLGKTGGALRGKADLEWIVSGFPHSDRIQEAHMAAIHIIIESVEARLFSHAVVS